MNSIPNPDDWMDVLTIIVATLIVAIPSWLSLRNHKSIIDIKDQVVNGHTTYMRADLDRAIQAIEALGHEVTALRQDLLAERDFRKAQVDDLRGDVDRMRRR